MAGDENPRGPVSCCPSIEVKYGRPIERWLAVVRGYSGMKHMEMVERLKTEYGLGHRHANASVRT